MMSLPGPALPNLNHPLSRVRPFFFFSFSSSSHPKAASAFSLSITKCHPKDDDVVIVGDCLVFEENAFDDPFLSHPNTFPNSTTSTSTDNNGNGGGGGGGSKKSRRRGIGVEKEELVPEEWKEVQAEINITKKERRRIAWEMEFNSRVEKKKKKEKSSVNLEEYQSYRKAMLARLNPVSLDDPSPSAFKVLPVHQDRDLKGGERVAPKNPRWAVYGKGFDHLNDLFESPDYVPPDKISQGPRKLFTKEEKALLNKRVPDLATATSSKWLPLHTLAASGEFYLMDALLKHNVDINAVDVDGLTALHRAIIGKKLAVTSYLLRESANPFVLDEGGATLIHYAVQTANIPAIKLLLLYNVDINLQDKDGWTPLHVAVQARRTDVVKLLLIRGADKTLKNRDGLTPLDLCLYSGRNLRTYELIKLMKQLPEKSTALACVSSCHVSAA